jgi:hypothetical protein
MPLGKHELPAPHYRRIQLMMLQGRDKDAHALLDALNAFNRAFGMPLFELPPPLADLPVEGLIVAPAEGAPLLKGGPRIENS